MVNGEKVFVLWNIALFIESAIDISEQFLAAQIADGDLDEFLPIHPIKVNWPYTLFIGESYTRDARDFPLLSRDLSKAGISNLQWSQVWKEYRTKKGVQFQIMETACPIQTSYGNMDQKSKRYPDFITIGVAKAGTSTMSFLDCHPKISYRDYETNFFTPPVSSHLENYLIPIASGDAIIIEKSPSYSTATNIGDLSVIAKNIKTANPSVKIILMIDDPIQRLFSHLRMCNEEEFSYCVSIEENLQIFDRFFSSKTTEEIYHDASDFNTNRKLIGFVTSGNYHQIITEYLEHFDSNEIFVVDGHQLKSDPNEEFKLLLDFMGINDNQLSWEYHPNFKKYCLYQPFKVCLGANKVSIYRKLAGIDCQVFFVSKSSDLGWI